MGIFATRPMPHAILSPPSSHRCWAFARNWRARRSPAGREMSQAGTFAALLKRHREAAELTQEELAERAGISSKAIGALERGARRRPYPQTIRQLADPLRLTGADRAPFAASASRRGDASEEPDLLPASPPPLA